MPFPAALSHIYVLCPLENWRFEFVIGCGNAYFQLTHYTIRSALCTNQMKRHVPMLCPFLSIQAMIAWPRLSCLNESSNNINSVSAMQLLGGYRATQ
eukprot:scaffold95617_cov16-Prasinocladus_malaysianus.AAC.2